MTDITSYAAVQEEIKKRALKFGNKSAHLQELMLLCQKEELSQMNVGVPEAHFFYFGLQATS